MRSLPLFRTQREKKARSGGTPANASPSASPLVPPIRTLSPSQSLSADNQTSPYNSFSLELFNQGLLTLATLDQKRIPDVEFDSANRRSPPRCLPQTRSEVLRALEDWFLSPGRLPSFLLSGPAGIGKTAIAQSFAELCSKNDRLGAAVLFSSQSQRFDVSGIIFTIAGQLARVDADYRRAIATALAEDTSLLDKTPHTLFRRLISQPFSHSQRPLVVIIDGLDGCADEAVQEELIKIIGEHVHHVDRPGTLLWLISLRSEWHLQPTFTNTNSHWLRLTCDDQLAIHILKDGIQKISKRLTPGQAKWISELEVNQLSSMVEGLPIAATSLLDFIGAHTKSPRKQVDFCLGLSQAIPMHEQNSPFQKLDELYQQVMGNIPDTVLPDAKRIIAFVIVHPTLPGKNRSEIPFDVAKFFACDRFQYSSALKALCPVIDFGLPESNPPPLPKFFNRTFSDFLRDKNRSGTLSLDMDSMRGVIDEQFRFWTNRPEGKAWLIQSGFPETFLDQYLEYIPLCRSLVESAAGNSAQAKLLAALEGADAQTMVDFLSELLNNKEAALSQHKKGPLLRLLFEVAKSAQVIPRSLELRDIDCEFGTPAFEGEFRFIYKGKHKDRLVCLKRTRFSGGKLDYVKRVKTQAGVIATWAHLSHQNIVPFLGVYFSSEGQVQRVSLVYPWMEGGDLAQYLTSSQNIRRIPLLYDIISGLQYLHESNIVHGDLRASNVYLSPDSRAMIANFDESEVVRTLMSIEADVTATSLRWKAPELMISDATPQKASDVWAFGCVCYEVMTNLEPYHELEAWELIKAVASERITPKKPSSASLSDEGKKIWPLAGKCWNYDPTLRSKSGELLDDFARLNLQDNRSSGTEISRTTNSEVEIKYDRVYKILRNIQQTSYGSLETRTEHYSQCQNLITSILESPHKTKQLVRLEKNDAQLVVDFLSEVLNNQETPLVQRIRASCLHLLSQLVKSAQVVPKSLEFQGAQYNSDEPVDAGDFESIYRGTYKDVLICIRPTHLSTSTKDMKKKLLAQALDLVTWAHLSHQNILSFLGFYFPSAKGEYVSLVSPWVDGGTLTLYLERSPDIPRLPLLHDIVSGVHYLHENNIIHGDLQGRNIYVLPSGRAVINFGTSRLSSTTAAETIYWKAPEMLTSKEGVVPSKASDIWAFGCTCYEAMTGLIPFHEHEAWQLVAAFSRRDAVNRKPARNSLPLARWKELDTVWPCAEKCWKYEPGHRPTSGELLSEFGVFHAHDSRPPLGIQAPPKATENEIRFDLEHVYETLLRIDRMVPGEEERAKTAET